MPANQPHFHVPWGAYRLVDRVTGDDAGTATMPTEPDTNGHCSVIAVARGDLRAPLTLLGMAIATMAARRRRRL